MHAGKYSYETDFGSFSALPGEDAGADEEETSTSEGATTLDDGVGAASTSDEPADVEVEGRTGTFSGGVEVASG